MYRFGFITLNPELEHNYFTKIAERAQKYKIECFRFAPTNINPITHHVSGEKYLATEKKWHKAEFPMPEILYDRCFYGEQPIAKTSLAIMKWLKKREDLLFLGSGLPNKWSIYETLSNSSLSPYIVRTTKAADPKQILALLNEERKIILKPAFGSGGMGIVKMEIENEKISICIDKSQEVIHSTFPNTHSAHIWLERLLNQKDYLIQPFLQLVDRQECPFDLRVLMQKDEDGYWVERGRGIRTGKRKGILSNLSAGAITKPFRDWIDTFDRSTSEFLNNELSEVLTQLPKIIEQEYPPLFELGIDIGISKDLGIWILDVNSKPGRKVVLETNPTAEDSLYEAPLVYGRKLVLNHEKVRQSNEKTLSNRNK
ncbi:YheC/D like ATP-grasp [Mesobacillus persicus]|uniref:YheC/D like ATP-grasp n=1 Tax=Mesobacillus persicus TaxID=930146 RepID=A0A1H8DX11_9BACI|nr:YheC/YheD family protein [Mesobacillus persicus]SEN11394.1 YheC/D like ATP-grasp [Mesobacillus persicus]